MTQPRPSKAPSLHYVELPDENELMVVDDASGALTVLNAEAASVWLLCDGTRDVQEIVGFLARELPPDGDPAEREGKVLEALALLAREALLR